MNKKTWVGLGLLALGALAMTGLTLDLFSSPEATAADHTDPPPRATGPGDSGDIGDLYAWHTSDKLITVLTFSGPAAPAAGQAGTYDVNTLYSIHLDTTGDAIPNDTIYVRFGQNAFGEWGVQASGVPGEAAPIVGPVEQEVTGSSAKVWAGIRDDPFFFDLQGFQDTVNTGTISFDATRDSFAGANITAVVIEMEKSAVFPNGDGNVDVWATTAKK